MHLSASSSFRERCMGSDFGRNKYCPATLPVMIIASRARGARKKEEIANIRRGDDEGSRKIFSSRRRHARRIGQATPLRPYFGRNSVYLKPGDILHGSVSLNHCEKRPFVLRTLMAPSLRCQGRGAPNFLEGRRIPRVRMQIYRCVCVRACKCGYRKFVGGRRAKVLPEDKKNPRNVCRNLRTRKL